MSDPGPYLVEVPLHETLGLYRAFRGGDRSPVLVKVPLAESPTSQDVERLRHEYEVTRSLADVRGVLHALALDELPGRGPVLVLEDFAGEPLGSLLGKPLPVEEFLRLAIPIARTLSEVHALGVLHKNLSPASWLVNRTTGEVRLTGFDIADFFPNSGIPSPSAAIDGRHAYMSPERWGRIDQALGPESDLYSLGITFFEMLTGVLPFEARDPQRWAHLHTAHPPIRPADLVPELPAVLSSIVEKLMAKNAADRYASALVLARDLERCVGALRAEGRIHPFVLAQANESEILRISRSLYGRTTVVDEILGAFDRVRFDGDRRCFFVSGAPGSGKSTIVADALARIAARGGRVLTGKFDQYARGNPYGPIAEAFDRALVALLTENAQDVARWGDSLRSALGPNGPLVAELVPHLSRFLGTTAAPQPATAVFTAQNRVHLGFRALAEVLASKDHPIVLFFDDLQWADEPNLALVERIASPDARHLFFVGAYRERELGSEHPLRPLLAATGGASAQTLSVDPFSPDELEQFLTDSLREWSDNARYLAKIVYSKTGGNPFFATQFVQSLCMRRLLRFDALLGRWLWNPGEIEAEAVTDNIVPWLIERLSTLSDVAQSALKLAACLGGQVEAGVLAAAWNRSEADVHQALEEPVRQGQLGRIGKTYRFVHDRIQQAAYSMIPEADRASMHLAVARNLHTATPPDRIEENIFRIVDHYNLAVELVHDSSERRLVFDVNLLAGGKAKSTAAFTVAASYFRMALGLLDAEAWRTNYQATYRLFLDGGECEYIEGRFDDSERLLMEVVDHADPVDAAPARVILMHLRSLRGDLNLAIETAVHGITDLQFELSSAPTDPEIEVELQRIWHELGDRPIESLIDLPPMTDHRAKAAMNILGTANTAGLLANPSFFSIVQLRAVNISLRYGNDETSPMTYVGFGMILRERLRRYEDAYRFGKLGFDLAERDPNSPYRARMHLGLAVFILPWKESSAPIFSQLERAFELARQVGDLSLACYCSVLFANSLLRRGAPLDQIARTADRTLSFVRAANYKSGEDSILAEYHLVLALLDRVSAPSNFAEADLVKAFEERIVSEGGPPIVLGRHFISKLMGLFLSGDYERAVAAGAEVKRLTWAIQSFPEVTDYVFYDALSLAAHSRDAATEARASMLAQVKEHGQKLREWADHCPANFEGRHALVAAEIAHLEGDVAQALRSYERAISAFRQEGIVHEEAIAYELAAHFVRGLGLETFADHLITEASVRYERWGALPKVRRLRELHPRSARTRQPGSRDAPLSPDQWDMLSLVKASQSISTEMETTALVSTLLRIMLEYAGAERVCLMFEEHEGSMLQAELSVNSAAGPVVRFAPPEGRPELPRSIVEFVKRTHESVLLDDAATEWPDGTDPYLARVRPKSILCVPILRQSSLVAVLHFENNFVSGAFSRTRSATIELLAEQVAISLQNNHLYSQLRRERDVLSRVMETVPVGIAVMDGQGRISFANGEARGLAAAHATSAAEDGFAAWRLLDLEGRPLPREHVPWVTALSSGRSVYDARVAIDAPTRRILSVNVAALPPAPESSAAPGVVVTFQDLTEQVRLDAQRRAVEERLIVSDRLQSMGVLAAGIAHEINNPLMYCMTNLTLLTLEVQKLIDVSPPSSPEFPRRLRDLLELLATTEKGLDRIRTIAADMRTFSRTEPTERRPVNVHNVLELTVKLAKGELRGRGTLATAYGQVPPVAASESRLAQVFLNLLINAIQSLPPTGEAANEIRLTTRTDAKGRAVVEIRDTGAGIPADVRPHIFDPFFTTKPIGTGSGLGLAICQSIVMQAGGEIEVETEPGSGSTFRVILPPHVSNRGNVPD